MTAVDDAPITTDAKRGFCSNCRRGSHALCTASMCTCTAREGHLNRPIGSQHRMPTGPSTPTRSPMPTPTKPAERATPPQIIWEDPPQTRGGRNADPVVPAAVCEALKARSGTWARVREYTAKSSAGSASARVRKGLLGSGWEAKARRTATGSALYLRFVGK